MAKETQPVVSSKDKKKEEPKKADAKVTASEQKTIAALVGDGTKKEVTPNWEKILYAPERVEKWLKGEMTMRQLHAISGPEMLEMAIVGFSMYEQGKYDEAAVIFQGLNALDPYESYYLTALGAVYLAQEDLEYAMKCFNQAIKLNEKEIASYVNRGEVYLRQGKVLEAAQDFKKAVDLDPEGKDPLTHRARLLAAAALETIEAVQKGAINADGTPKQAAGSKPAAKPAGKPAAKSSAKPAGKKK